MIISSENLSVEQWTAGRLGISTKLLNATKACCLVGFFLFVAFQWLLAGMTRKNIE